LEDIDATPRMSWIKEDDKLKNIVQFICLGEKVGGNILKDYNTFTIFVTLQQIVTLYSL
jgi:hypothetical protein